MNPIHIVLGFGVIALNGAGGVAALRARRSPEVPVLVGWGVAVLALQLASGFFLVTGTVEGPGALHTWLPAAALAGLVGARMLTPPARNLAVGAAALVAAAIGVGAAVSGFAS